MTEVSQEQLKEAAVKLKARAERLVKAAGLDVTVTLQEMDCTDPFIELGDTGVCVGVFSGYVPQQKSLGKKKAPEQVMYGAYYTVIIPGRRYYPDGSGEPDDVDVVEVGQDSNNPDQPIIEALKTHVQFCIEALREHEADEAEAEFYREMQDAAHEQPER